MTFDQNTHHDDEFDSFDPLIAERFEVLNSVPVPGHGEQVQPLHPVAPPPAIGYRPLIGLAAAAALFVIVGVSFLATRPDTNQDVTASNSAEEVAQHSTVEEDQTEDAEQLTVSVPPSSTTQPSTVEGTDAEPGAEQEEPTEDEAGSASGETETTEAPAPPTTKQQDGTTTETTTTTTTVPTPTSAPPKESMPPVSEPAPVQTTDVPDMEDRVIILRGIVEEVFTDCESKLILDEDGQVAQGGPVSCDGGSYVVIDGRRIQTSAGFVSADQYYDRHNSRIRPGQSVLVLAVPSEWSADRLTLNCGQCGITLGG